MAAYAELHFIGFFHSHIKRTPEEYARNHKKNGYTQAGLKDNIFFQ